MSNYLITGANAGLGWDACRQLALREDTSLVYLACRSSDKARKAIDMLIKENKCPSDKLKYIHFDACETKAEIESIVKSLDGIQLHGVVLNAGGAGDDPAPVPSEPNGVLNIVQVNVVGHIQLIQVLQRKNILAEGCRIIFSGSESARGIPIFLAPTPKFGDTVEFYDKFMTTGMNLDPGSLYGTAKGLGTLYFAEYARAFPQFKILTVSPGGTLGTNALHNPAIPMVFKIILRFFWLIAYCLGRFQDLDQGAKKYIDAVTGACDEYPSGTFLACSVDLAGPLCNQAQFDCGQQFTDRKKQKAAYKALEKFL